MCRIFCSVFLVLCFSLPCPAQTLEGSVDFTPWSGYWWPVALGELYNGYAYDTSLHPSPIEKHDFARLGGYPGELSVYAQDPKNFIFVPDAPGWHGYCDALANAVLLEHIDFSPSFFK
ncbi:MAG: hypothetical protein EOM12_15640, partial [Verrucomicrobiae bacterium]|nr:hypothetical protein [Verrucomicrobiae bacterium]